MAAPNKKALIRFMRGKQGNRMNAKSMAGSYISLPFKGAKVGFRGALLRATVAGRLCKADRGPVGVGMGSRNRKTVRISSH